MINPISKRFGSPYDRGSADRYYGRRFDPHYYDGATGGTRIVPPAMTEEQVAEYRQGWEDEQVAEYRQGWEDEQVAEYRQGWEDEQDRKEWND